MNAIFFLKWLAITGVLALVALGSFWPNPQPSTLNLQPSESKHQVSGLNPQSPTLNPQQFALKRQLSGSNPQPRTLNPIPPTISPQPPSLNPDPPDTNQLGVATDISKADKVQDAGYHYLEPTIVDNFSPRKYTEEQFQAHLQQIKKLKVRIESCNVFFPGNLKLTGPDVHEAAVLGYVDTVMKRCRDAGVKLIVLGSGTARKLEVGVDSVRAAAQFISLCRKIAQVAAKYDRIIALENLNHTETNFILTLGESIRYARAVDHPNFKLTADLYHMLMENESASVIETAKDLIAHVHVAEKEGRAYPGKRGTNFVPYLKALRNIGYQGKIMLECRWDNSRELIASKSYMIKQLELSHN